MEMTQSLHPTFMCYCVRGVGAYWPLSYNTQWPSKLYAVLCGCYSVVHCRKHSKMYFFLLHRWWDVLCFH